MGAGHAHALYVHEHSRLHLLAPETKMAAAFVFVFAVALTPRRAIWAFVLLAGALAVLITVARIGFRFVASRLLVVVPFVAFAFLIPFIASGEQVDILGLSVSLEGLWGAWNILAKATIGATVSILLAATTEVPDMLRGMARLRVPALLTSVAGFMVRYLEVIIDELRRMRTSMTARGYDPRWLWQVRPIAQSAGALFIRSYERGERVYDAMLSRGFTGVIPDLGHRRATPGEWLVAATLPILGVTVMTVALLVT